MKMRTISILITAIIVFVFCGIFTGQIIAQENSASKISSQIIFNGYLTDKLGKPYTSSNYNFTIYIYDSPDSRTPLWTETHENVSVKDGAFTLNIGQDKINDASTLKFDKKYYIGIKINNEDEMQQRLEFGTAAYSLGAKYADGVSDGSITTEKLADKSITDDKIQSFSLNKIINLPKSIGSVDNIKSTFGIAGADYEWWTTFGNIIYGPERHFIGTRNDRDFVIGTWEIERMRFDPHGYITLGTPAYPVNFEVFGYSTFDYVFIQGNLGVGVDPALAKVHIDSPLWRDPFRIEYQMSNIFSIDSLGRVVITSSLSGADTDINNYPVIVKGGDQGVGIDIEGTSEGENNYVSFWDDSGMVGRIEGQTAGEYASQPQSITTDAYLAALIVAEAVAVVSFLYPLPIPTEPADIIRCAADIAEIVFLMEWDYLHLGVTYESASGDYAEWLERKDNSELMTSGDIVAVSGGKISLNTTQAEQYMVISTSPIILGNMKDEKEINKFEKVAYMGQVPVKVRGEVHSGDFIIPSGLNDGTGIALAPVLMTADEMDKIVGRAWSSSSNESMKMVNILAGVNSNDIGQILRRMNSETNSLMTNMKNVEDGISTIKTKINFLKKSINKFSEEFKNIKNDN